MVGSLDRRDLTLPGIVDIGAVMVEGAHCADDTDHGCHRMGVAAEPAKEVVHLLVHHRVARDAVFEILQLFGRRKLAVQQQEADFEIARLFGQLVDRIAAIQKLALVAVDIGDGTFAGGGRGEPRVVGEDIAFGVKLADVDHIGPQHGRLHRQRQHLVVKGQCRGLRGFCGVRHVSFPCSPPGQRRGAGADLWHQARHGHRRRVRPQHPQAAQSFRPDR